jgi:repressor of nif and glnA expression
MIGQETREVERKITAILKVLSDSAEPLGGRTISRRLREQGVDLSERTVRYHLKLTDERGLTYCAGQRDGRSITQPGLDELKNALVCDKVGFVISRIELLAYLTTFDLDKRSGNIPIDVSLFSKKGFSRAMNIMVKIYEAGLSVTDLVAVATEGERLGDVVVPQGKIGLATVASVIINGAFLIAGIPIASCFGGILQMRNHEPLRFVDLVEYDGSTLDPFEIFIAGRMTEVDGASRQGAGKILASFHEIPMPSSHAALEIINGLKEAELCNWLIVGKPNGLVCEMPARLNHVGLLLPSALNPVAAVAEAGVEVTCRTMSGVIDVERLKNFRNI